MTNDEVERNRRIAERTRGRGVQVGDLPDSAQDLLANAATLLAILDPQNPVSFTKQTQDEALRSVAEKIGHDVEEVISLVAGLLDQVLALEADRQHLREQLEKIGKKAFWARREE